MFYGSLKQSRNSSFEKSMFSQSVIPHRMLDLASHVLSVKMRLTAANCTILVGRQDLYASRQLLL